MFNKCKEIPDSPPNRVHNKTFITDHNSVRASDHCRSLQDIVKMKMSLRWLAME